jgi:hypothetical protein
LSEAAYVDSSCLVAIALGEPVAKHIAARIAGFRVILAHPLLDAEVRCACAREGQPLPDAELQLVHWIDVDRPISDETDRVLSAGYVRGADCLHLATALYLAPDPRQLTFLTLDTPQRAVARALGFRT